jgi:hypothetical protein
MVGGNTLMETYMQEDSNSKKLCSESGYNSPKTPSERRSRWRSATVIVAMMMNIFPATPYPRRLC